MVMELNIIEKIILMELLRKRISMYNGVVIRLERDGDPLSNVDSIVSNIKKTRERYLVLRKELCN